MQKSEKQRQQILISPERAELTRVKTHTHMDSREDCGRTVTATAKAKVANGS